MPDAMPISSSGVPPEPQRINDRRRGNRLGFLSFIWALRLFGRPGAYGLLRMVALYYVLFDPLARRLALPYISRRFPDHTGRRRMIDFYRLFYNQGISLIDRFRMLLAPEAFTRKTAGFEKMQSLLADRKRGFILLVSHVGNWQAMMLALANLQRNVTLLMRPEENPLTQHYLHFRPQAPRIRAISPDEPLGGVIELTQRFEQGDVIAVMGDRAYDASTMTVDFLGAPARFPCGPFRLAAAWDCPLAVMFAGKTGMDEYTVEWCDIIRIDRSGDRREGLHRAMQSYAGLLEDFSRRHPYQVYLFEDAWRNEPPPTGTAE